jgi:serine protease AprX
LTAPLTGLIGIIGGSDLSQLTLDELPYYTSASGTSFSAPQVAGSIALMLEANPFLTTGQVRDILQRSATPLPPHYSHEVGAGMLNAHAAALESAFAERRMGMFRATLDRGQVRFVNDPFQQFSGTVPFLGTYSTSRSIPSNAVLASFQVAWGPLLNTNDLMLTVTDPAGVTRNVNTLNLPGLTGKRERLTVAMPLSGSWSIKVKNALLLGPAQSISGTVEVTRAEYSQLIDIGGLSAAAREEVYQNLRSFVMWPSGKRFRPEFAVSRASLATALVLGARVPQYIPGQDRYFDARDAATMIMVESVQAAPGRPLSAG